MSKIVNVTVEEYATFTKLLTLTYSELVAKGTHPITGATIYETVRKPIDLTGYSFTAAIKENFNSPDALANFTVTILSAAEGQLTISLSRELTSTLADKVDWGHQFGRYSERIGVLGYYDVLATKDATTTRLMQGQVFFSRGTTESVASIVTHNVAVQRSISTPITSPVELNVQADFPSCYVGVQYFLKGQAVTPTDGYMEFYRAPESTQLYGNDPEGVVYARNVAGEVVWKGNTSKVKAVPVNIQGADSYVLTVVCNKS